MSLVSFRKEVERNIRKAEQMYGVDFSNVTLEFNIGGWKCIGKAQARANRFTGELFDLRLRFHPLAIKKHYQEMVSEVIPHEVAHMVMFLKGNVKENHGFFWRRACIELGGTGEAHHSFDISKDHNGNIVVPKKVFVYRCQNGQEVQLRSGRHSRLQNGRVISYTHRQFGKIRKQDFLRREIV